MGGAAAAGLCLAAQMNASAPIPTIVVLGGGTAGWMAACLMKRAWPAAEIIVVESPTIGIVGVGEGSTPQLKALFDDLGIDEAEWMAAAHATYKVGIRFVGWSDRPGFEEYFHPFASPVDLHTEPDFHRATLWRRHGHNVAAHPDAFFLNSWLARHNRSPIAPDHFPFQPGYGFHFDAHLVGEVLRRHAVGRGVRHLPRDVRQVVVGEDGNIAYLVVDGDERLPGDFFVDASGFASVIADQALKVPFRSFSDNLFNDRAVTIPTARPTIVPNYTTATALPAGWAWSIPLTNRTGNGYVYASSYSSPDEAETALRRHLGLLDADVPVRHLTMRVGRVETSWTGNCLAVGLAQGFIEPLEATALHIVQATVQSFIAACNQGDFSPAGRDDFNAALARRYEGIRDYIVAHYRLNLRRDNDYWRANAENSNLSPSLKALMTCWFTAGELHRELERLDLSRFYSSLSWGCLFAGYGNFPSHRNANEPFIRRNSTSDFLDRCGSNFQNS